MSALLVKVAEIVRDLAALDPRDDDGFCTLCGEFASAALVLNSQPNVPSMHLPTCPWRRAMETTL